MNTSFPGLLGYLEAIGVIVQRIARKLLSLFIGSQAYDWSLDALPRDNVNFKAQRFIREFLGLVSLLLLQTPLAELDPSPAHLFGENISIWFNLAIWIELIIYWAATKLRGLIESKSDGSDSNAKT